MKQTAKKNYILLSWLQSHIFLTIYKSNEIEKKSNVLWKKAHTTWMDLKNNGKNMLIKETYKRTTN